MIALDKDSITVLLGGAALAVSLVTFGVAFAQMRISSAKARLDLYNKRFAVYEAALDYYQALWHEHEKVKERSIAITKAYRESQFLFDAKDGVYSILGKIQQHGHTAKFHLEEIQKHEGHGGPGKMHDALNRQKKSQHLEAYEGLLKELESRVGKYIQFTEVSGWTVKFWRHSNPAKLNAEKVTSTYESTKTGS
ncbi:hypothetical protein NJD74_17465 [Stenotrophomonas sp. RG-453]|nr:hypothetical protein [Stenotrophomonas sp. RG-453]